MFGERNISKLLSTYKDIFGFSIELEWCKYRRRNRYILKVNAGEIEKPLYYVILSFTKDAAKFNFKRVEFIDIFKSCDSEYWVLKLKHDTKIKRIIGDKDLIVSYI